jgi:predicted NAD/FAD-dependent oxidoreductase
MTRRLAVIGAGIGGCSAAYFARRHIPNEEVTLYEAQPRIGGRILTQPASGTNLELGAAFFNDMNPTVKAIIEVEHLEVKRLDERTNFAVWNGSEFVFRSNKQSIVTELELLAKYKLSLARTFLQIREAKQQFTNLHQTAQENPADVGELFEAAGLDKWYKKPFDELLSDEGVSRAFIDEAVSPITRTIYSQNADLGGLAGVSSLIGVYAGTMHNLTCGNSTLPDRLAEKSQASVHLGRKVDVVEKTPSGSFRVHADGYNGVFDGVFIAVPLETAEIKFEGVSMPNFAVQPYRVVYRRVVRGVFNPCYFGLEKGSEVPAVVLTTKEADPITQIGIQRVGNGEALVTVSSTQPIRDEAFEGMFKAGWAAVLEHQWRAAYPLFKPVAKLPPTRLDDGLLYVSAVEQAVASMETAAFSAWNAVKLLSSRLR